MPRRNWLKLGGFAAILLVAALLVGIFSSDSKPIAASTSDGADSNVDDDAVRKALTVTSVPDEFCLEKVVEYGGSTVAVGDDKTVVSFKDRIGALKGTPPRLWSDALTTPYMQTEWAKMLEETQAEVCSNPHYGVTVANLFANMSVGDVKLSEINDWLTPFAGDAALINDKASEFIPLLDVTSPTDTQKEQAVVQNLAWQQVAGKLGTLLSRFQEDGVRPEKSVLNYHLVAGGASVGGLPEVGLNPNQENLPALVLKLTEKGACAPLKVIGFNTGDKRPEEFTPPTCEKPAPPSEPKAPAPKPRKPGTPATTAPPTREKIPTTTVPATTVPKQTTTTVTSGKQTPTTQAPPPTTAPTSSTTAQPSNGGQGDSGDGATNTTSPPTTQAPAPSPPTTSSPTTNPPPPPG